MNNAIVLVRRIRRALGEENVAGAELTVHRDEHGKPVIEWGHFLFLQLGDVIVGRGKTTGTPDYEVILIDGHDRAGLTRLSGLEEALAWFC